MRAKLLRVGIGLGWLGLMSGCGLCDRYCERQEKIYGHKNNPCCYPAPAYNNPCCYPTPVGGAVQPVPATNYYQPGC